MLEENLSTLMRLIFVLCASSCCWSVEVSNVTVESVTLDTKSLIYSKDAVTVDGRGEQGISTSVTLKESQLKDVVETESDETGFAESSPYISSTDTIVGDFNVTGLPWPNNNTEITIESDDNESELDAPFTKSTNISSVSSEINFIRSETNQTEDTNELNITVSNQHSISSTDASSNVKQSAILQQSGFKETHEANVPYHVSSDSGKVHNLRLNHKHNKFEIKHHLQLVPMEDEPFGTIVMKNQRFMISVLVPIGVCLIGVVLIVGTVLTLRYIARQRPRSFPLDNESTVVRRMKPSVSSISAETTDKTFLLLRDEEI